ncbi:MAG: gliding motility-associated C-terminal domain-containing protein [Flavobacteriales bacterium]|nr:gliding motility-associated C-terminal domain-containing protein [Flavobacteriales bacterium]MCB9449308.1 gliding motility-associated C-terminal domain-containing protein [Flavobacteriales bacterium]
MSLFRLLLTLVLSIVFGSVAISQTELKWATRYAGSGAAVDRAADMVIDASGNVYVTGTATGSGSPSSLDYLTVKYNNAGVQQWAKYYNGSGNGLDEARSIAVDASGNVYVTGMSYGSGTDYDIVTIKYNSAGTQQWSARYNTISANLKDEGYDVKVDGSGNVYVTGAAVPFAQTETDVVTIKYNSSGTQQWATTYDGNGNGTGDDGGYALALDASGNVYVTGFSYWNGAQDYNVVTLKYNSSGAQQWASQYNGPGSAYDAGFAITLDGSNNVYVAAQALKDGVINFDITTIKYNNAGTQQWVKQFGGDASDIDKPNDIKVDASNNVYVVGKAIGTGTGEDYATLKYTSAGTLSWSSIYNGSGNGYDEAKMLQIDPNDGTVYVTGYSNNGASSADYVTLKYDNTDGKQLWKVAYNGPDNLSDQAVALAVDNTYNVYVSGYSFGTNTTTKEDYATLKYCQYSSNISGNDTICAGDTTQLSASGGTTYSWSPSTGLSDPNIANPKAFPSVTTTYVLTASNSYNCTDIDSVTIYVNPLPQPTITASGDSSLCQGEQLTLSTQSFASYLWSSGNTTSSIISDTTGTFTVTVVDTNGCTNTSASYSMIVHPLPTVSAGTDTSLCIGDTIQLNASGATNYAWTPSTGLSSTTIANPLAHPVSTIKYYLTGTDSVTTCLSKDTIMVTVNALPVITASNDTSICPGDTAQLHATGGTQYLWTPSGTLDDNTSSDPKAGPAATTTYYLTVTDNNQCSRTENVKVTVYQKPAPVISPAGPIDKCEGESVTLTCNTFPNYLWSNGSTSKSITTDSSGTYNVTVTDSKTCSNTSSNVVVTIHPLPVVDAGMNDTICKGDSIQLNATGADSYSWSPGTGLSSTKISNPKTSPPSTITYTVTGSVMFGSLTCKNTDQVSVKVNNLPTVATSNDTAVCLGESANLNASGGVNFSWSPTGSLDNPNISNPVATPTATTTYTVTVQDTNSCANTGTVKVTIYPLPTLNVGSDIDFCEGDSAKLTVTNGASYLWSTGATTQSITVKTTGTYSVTVTDNHSCSNSASVNVTVHPNPVADAGTDQKICRGTSTQLTATGGDQYLWYPSDVLDNANIASPTATPTKAITLFIVTVTNSTTGCSSTDTVSITANTLTGADAGPNKSICPGDSTQLNASGGDVYSWTPVAGLDDPNASNPKASPASTTWYYVLVTNSTTAGCKTDSAKITVYPTPSIDAGSTTTVIKGDSTQLQLMGDLTGATILWTPSTWLSAVDIADPWSKPTETITYHVSVISANGCPASDSVTIEITIPKLVPEGISPNQDGKNDTWKLDFVQTLYPNAIVEVYDRWGLRVFYSKGYPKEWDGTYEEKPLPSGTYYYIINLGDGSEPMTGPLTIIR